ncbi:MAG: translational GTPase TypA [Bacteroidales bacterium]|nr:translational GTPase TypA [Bacteroidales bacterium]MCF8377457.1 translational GTPase TypA [Bacteroidales bacterium]MCF8401546.1 translational GTPase TypA [Bacteroidales bacterium]
MQNIRNIAIIAHVDHGKTTLVDRILHQVKMFRDNQSVGDLILDSNELEKERGITILSKNVSVRYKGVKINIIDTPGHADFGGEVERVLNMADGVLLLVDAFEGPMPQTRFVLEKALKLNLKPIVVINKVDKPNCKPIEIQEQVFDLMMHLHASEEQLDFPTVYGSSKYGWMGPDFQEPAGDVSHLLDVILDAIPPPKYQKGSPQMRITSMDYSSYQGQIAVGRLSRGKLQMGMPVSLVKRDGNIIKSQIKELYVFEGLGKEKKKEPVHAGEIVALMGLSGFELGDTVADFENPEGLSPINIDEPTMSMVFTINTSPFYGRDGTYLTSRHLRDRLIRETEKNLAMRVEETNSPEVFNVYGRGILHLSILVETMRREGYEFQLGQPRVIQKKINDVMHEPVEHLTVNVPGHFQGRVIEACTQRKAMLTDIEYRGDRNSLQFHIPSRGLIGLTGSILTLTEGEAVIAHRFIEFQPLKGDIPIKRNGALVALETGAAIPYAIDKLQDRGVFFVNPGEDIYRGQVVGEHNRGNDIVVNLCKTKKLSNMRASGSDEKMRIAPAKEFSLEQYMEYINADEYLEVTPLHLRIRKIEPPKH